MSALDVIEGRARHSVERADAVAWLRSLPEGSVDLLVCSPPYERARLYLESGEDMGIARDTEEWVAWLVEVCEAMRQACRGLCVLVVEGQTRSYRYSAGPLLLAADLHRRGFHLRKPPIYRRVGIPGSGGPDWWRNDYEFCLCFTRGGKLPWSDNTATGHAPKWAPGGEMSHRLSNGSRVNKWGGSGKNTFRMPDGTLIRQTGEGSQPGELTKAEVLGLADDEPLLFDGAEALSDEPDPWHKHGRGNGIGGRKKDGSTKKGSEVERRTATPRERANLGPRRARAEAGENNYDPPAIANPGNVVQETYTAEDLADLIGEPCDVLDCNVGGGQMGDPCAHDNEAPFPEDLVEPYVRCFCPPDGIVADCFAGSGTTLAVALKWGRRAIGADLRQSQVDLTSRRLSGLGTLFD